MIRDDFPYTYLKKIKDRYSENSLEFRLADALSALEFLLQECETRGHSPFDGATEEAERLLNAEIKKKLLDNPTYSPRERD